MTRSELFKAAWRLARQGAARFGGSARRYFAAALRMIYASLVRPSGAAALARRRQAGAALGYDVAPRRVVVAVKSRRHSVTWLASAPRATLRRFNAIGFCIELASNFIKRVYQTVTRRS